MRLDARTSFAPQVDWPRDPTMHFLGRVSEMRYPWLPRGCGAFPLGGIGPPHGTGRGRRLPRQVLCNDRWIELRHRTIRQPIPDFVLAQERNTEIAAHRQYLAVGA